MILSNFIHLADEFPILFNIGQAAEFNLHKDPITTLFKLRQFGERLTEILFEELCLEFPSENTFHSRLKELDFAGVLPVNVRDLLYNIKNKGNIAVHKNVGDLNDAKGTLYSAFKVAKWFYQSYSKENKDISELRFHVPEDLDARHSLYELEQQYKELEKKFEQLLEQRNTQGLPKAKIEEIKVRSEKAAKKIEMSEAETRELIDAQLRQAGWEANTGLLNFKLNKTLPQRGKRMAIAEWPCGKKWADYALFIGTQLYGIVESKRYAQDISTDLQQAKVYAELVEQKHEAMLLGKWNRYNVPFLFATNGRPYLEQIKTKSGVWFLDVRNEYNNSKALQGWYSPDGLEKLYQKDLKEAEAKLKKESTDFLSSPGGLGLREYQLKAIHAVEDLLLNKPESTRALLAMATGTGKTRTIIGLCYRLIQSNRFRRILFLVDRTLLAIQAFDAFKDNKIVGLNTFSEIYEIKGLKDLVPDIETRLHFATVQGMVKRLFYSEKDENTPSVDQYDCIIIDEAHRGYLLDREIDEDDLIFKNQYDYVSKYRMVLDYFDAFIVGLTATPALHTTDIFGKPVYTYSYREAVIDGFLIDHEPPYIIKTKLGEQGITWEKGEKPKALDRESNEIVELEQLEDELNIDIAGFNKLVITENFNRTVVTQLVQELDPESDEKTLIFAATDEHADLVVQLLKEEFTKIGIEVPDEAIQKITGKSYTPKELFRNYKNEKYPNIAVTVDLLTTGIDVHAICNLVFLRRIKSRILYEQMLGRATRRCDDIGKETFRVYDAVKVYETLKDYSQMKPVVTNPQTTFQQLVEEFEHIDNEKRAKRQVEQIIAKLQRKKRHIYNNREEQFKYHSNGADPDKLIEELSKNPGNHSVEQIIQLTGLWKYLDELKPVKNYALISEHEDELKEVERGYGKGNKPDDYIENFKKYIQENQNAIAALKIICTRPADLDRKSLKELMLKLADEGFSARTLNIAWKESKNEDIAADIISYIRTLALGSSLVSHEERIKRAMNKIREMHDWNKVQTRWIDRFEMQLIQETVLQIDDLDKDPFDRSGGKEKLNKIFNNRLDSIFERLNKELYSDIA